MSELQLPPVAAGARRILGIDPGNAVTGWGVVDRQGTRLLARAHGVWRGEAGLARSAALARLSDRLIDLIRRVGPQIVAIEEAFLGKNIQSALRLGEARGALLAAAARVDGIRVVEYPTASVKKAVVGNGRADKRQVQFMTQKLLGLAEPPRPLDASDALAIAVVAATDPALLPRPMARVADRLS